MANRTIRLYKDYFKDFYITQTDAVRNKINYCINMVKTLDRIPTRILRFIEGTDGLYEIRVEVGNNISESFVVLTWELWLSFSMASKRKHQRLLPRKKKKLSA